MGLGMKLYAACGPVDAVGGPTAVTVGVFDGVHRGHRDLLRQLREAAGGRPTVAVTLTTHPSFALGRSQTEQWLDEADEHRSLLLGAGADYVAELPFDAEVARLTACGMARWLHERLRMGHLLVGYDSRFGSREADDFGLLPDLGRRLGFGVGRGERYLCEGVSVSSSAIRHELRDGRVDQAARLLGRPYGLRGTVVHGRGAGRGLGFPTANIDLSATRKMLPAEGVYAVRLDGREGVANLGAAPTFGIGRPTLEVHLPDFEGDLYGRPVEVTFVRRLRGTRRFDSAEQLRQQIRTDIESLHQQ